MNACTPLFALTTAFCLLIAGCATPKPIVSAAPLKPGEIVDVHAGYEAQARFGIFLTVNRDLDTRPGMVDLAHVQLEPSPVISANDIISYDFANQAMKLRPEALSRIPHPPVSGLPFVVVADGQRIYLGAFWTELSSMSCEAPTIAVDKALLDKSQARDVQMIDRAYPTDAFGKGPDPRGDPRIKNALEALHKLK